MTEEIFQFEDEIQTQDSEGLDLELQKRSLLNEFFDQGKPNSVGVLVIPRSEEEKANWSGAVKNTVVSGVVQVQESNSTLESGLEAILRNQPKTSLKLAIVAHGTMDGKQILAQNGHGEGYKLLGPEEFARTVVAAIQNSGRTLDGIRYIEIALDACGSAVTVDGPRGNEGQPQGSYIEKFAREIFRLLPNAQVKVAGNAGSVYGEGPNQGHVATYDPHFVNEELKRLKLPTSPEMHNTITSVNAYAHENKLNDSAITGLQQKNNNVLNQTEKNLFRKHYEHIVAIIKAMANKNIAAHHAIELEPYEDPSWKTFTQKPILPHNAPSSHRNYSADEERPSIDEVDNNGQGAEEATNVHAVEEGHPVGTGFNVGMTLLGLGGVYSAIRRGDTIDTVIGAGQTATGATGLGVEVGLKTGLVRMSTAVQSLTKTIPFVGTIFCAYAAVEDAEAIYKAVKEGNTRGIVKGAVDMTFDIAIGVSGLIPGLGTATTIALAAARMFTDSVIDQMADPHAYQKTFLAMADPRTWWLEKGLAAVTGGIQYALEEVVDAFIPWRMEYFVSKQQSPVLEKLKDPARNQNEFFQSSEKNGMYVLDFSSAALAHHSGGLEVNLTSNRHATVSFTSAAIDGQDYTLNTSIANFNPNNAPTLCIIMGQGGTYTYTWLEELTFKGNVDVIGRVELKNETLTSTYYAPQDGTCVTFVAPHNPRLGDSGFPLVESRGTLGAEEFTYNITGGTGQNAYFLGYQKTNITCGAGSNAVHIPANSEKEHHVKLIGFRDDGTCSLTMEHISDLTLMESATLERDVDPSKLLLKSGNLIVELPSILKKLVIKTSEDGGSFALDLQNVQGPQQLIKTYLDTADITPEFTQNLQKTDYLHEVTATGVNETFMIDAHAQGEVEISDFDLRRDKIKIHNLSKEFWAKLLNKEFTCKLVDERGTSGSVTVIFHGLNYMLKYSADQYQDKFFGQSLTLDTGAGYFTISFEKYGQGEIVGTAYESDLPIREVTFTPRTVDCIPGRKDSLRIKASDTGTLTIKNFESQQDSLKLQGFAPGELQKVTVQKGDSHLHLFFDTIDVKIYGTEIEFLTFETETGVYIFNVKNLRSASSPESLWAQVVSSAQERPNLLDHKAPYTLEGTQGRDIFGFTKGAQVLIKNFNYEKDLLKISDLPTDWFENVQVVYNRSQLKVEIGTHDQKTHFSLESSNPKILILQTDDGEYKVDIGGYISNPTSLKDYIVSRTVGLQALQSTDTDVVHMGSTPGHDVFMVSATHKRKTSIQEFDFAKDQLKIVNGKGVSINEALISLYGNVLQITCCEAIIEFYVSPKAKTLFLSTEDALFEVDIAALKATPQKESTQLKPYIVSTTYGLINHMGEKALRTEYSSTHDVADTFIVNAQQAETLYILNFELRKDKVLVANLEPSWLEQAGTGVSYDSGERTLSLTFGNKTNVKIVLTDEAMDHPLIVESEGGAFAFNISALVTDVQRGSPKALKNYSIGSLLRSKSFKDPEISDRETFYGTSGADEFVLNAHNKGATQILNFDATKDHVQVLNLDSVLNREPEWWLKAEALKNGRNLVLKLDTYKIEIESQNIGSTFALKVNDGVYTIDTSRLTDTYLSLTLAIKSAEMGYKNFMVAENSKVAANDIFIGTSGKDTMIINSKHAGKTVIKGFEDGKDKMYFIPSSTPEERLTYEDIFSKSQDVGGNIVIMFDPDNEVTIENFQKSQFTVDDFMILDLAA